MQSAVRAAAAVLRRPAVAVVLLVGVTVAGAPASLIGQARGGFVGGASQRPPDRSAGPAAPGGERHGRRGPSPPAIQQPFTSRWVLMRPPVAHRGRPAAFRSFLGGLLLFDPFWSWPQRATAEAFMGVTARPQRDDLPVGGLQLDVDPRRGQVYADGWYVGVVDDFSGYYRHLSLGAGSHIIEIVADGYVPLTFEIVISPGRTATYRGALPRALGRE